MEPIKIYTDGSCLGNPGFGGWGAIILNCGKEKILKGASGRTTNNRMELKAIVEAIRYMKTRCTGTEVHIYSDSRLFIESITKGWKRKKNLDLWKEFDEVHKGVDLHWHWVKGHHTDKYNNKVDAIAQNEAQKAKKMNLPPDPGLVDESKEDPTLF